MSRTYIISLLISASLLPVLILPGCGQGENGGPSYPGLEINTDASGQSSLPLFLQEATPAYRNLSEQLKDALNAYTSLDAFKWQGLESLGYWEIQSAGAACQAYDKIYSKDEQAGAFAAEVKWIALSTMIPSPERVKTVGLALNRSLETAVKINPVNFYSKTAGSPGNQSQKEWLDLCKGLDATLKSAIYLATTMEKTCNFASVNEAFKKASSGTRDAYLSKFQDQSKQFSSLLAALISRLNTAEAAAFKLTGADVPQK